MEGRLWLDEDRPWYFHSDAPDPADGDAAADTEGAGAAVRRRGRPAVDAGRAAARAETARRIRALARRYAPAGADDPGGGGGTNGGGAGGGRRAACAAARGRGGAGVCGACAGKPGIPGPGVPPGDRGAGAAGQHARRFGPRRWPAPLSARNWRCAVAAVHFWPSPPQPRNAMVGWICSPSPGGPAAPDYFHGPGDAGRHWQGASTVHAGAPDPAPGSCAGSRRFAGNLGS
jgi:hypothetical protein